MDIIDCSGGYAARRDSDPHLHVLPTDFPIGVYVPVEGGDWGDSGRGRENGYEHPSEECPLHNQHDWIRDSAWSSNRLQLEAIDRPYERETIRFALVSLIEQVYGTQVHSWTPNLPPRRTFSGGCDGHDFDEEDYQKQVAEDEAQEARQYLDACSHQVGYALCSDLLGFALRPERTALGQRVWTHPNEVISQLQELATKHGCDVGDVRDIALWLDSDHADHDPARAAEHGLYDLCVDVAEVFGLEYDRDELAALRRMADGPDYF